MPTHTCEHNEFAVAQRGSGNSGNDTENGPEAVVDSVDSVPDPACRFGASGLPRGQKLVERFSRLVRGKRWKRTPIANQTIEYLIVLAFVCEHLPKDDHAWLVADSLDLFGVLGDVLGFVQLQAPQRHVNATDAICEVIGFTGSGPGIGEFGTSQRTDTPSPKISVPPFGAGKRVKGRAPLRVGFLFCQRCVGFAPTHLGPPITFQDAKDSFAFLWIQVRVGDSGVCVHQSLSRNFSASFEIAMEYFHQTLGSLRFTRARFRMLA
jgi:hypothetical protein